jgi:8-oxo-dGTP pyrophosphatase MutT (NUDIX family)
MTERCLQSFNKFVRCLESADFSNLPGVKAQLLMAPSIRHTDILNMGIGRNPVKSSVLLLFYPGTEQQVTTVLIQRPEYDGAHSGQISFPGGRFEPGDTDLAYTALRETHEEIGVDPGMVDLKGRLTDLFIPPSNFIVTPFLGISESRPTFIPDPGEVAAILEISLKDLLNPACREMKVLTLRDGYRLETPCFNLNGNIIWGATAMIISEMAKIIEAL